MALAANARESNVRDSIKKFFVDNIETTENIPVTFDKALIEPDLTDKAVDKWVNVSFGDMIFGRITDVFLAIHVCTRRDSEGFRLAQVRDKVVGYLSDTTMTDGYKRIPFYQSSATQDWTLIGAFLVIDVRESAQLQADDETKYKTLDVMLRTTSTI
jgi:hypothetical protein